MLGSTLLLLLATTTLVLLATTTLAQQTQIPVKEISVFKDGHAFIMREGVAQTDSEGYVWVKDLPSPVLGTFWPYSNDEIKLIASTAGRRVFTQEQVASDIRTLLEANAGADVIITERTQDSTQRYPAQIISIPRPPKTSPEEVAGEAKVVLLRTAEGVKAVEIAQIQDVTFKTFNEKYKNEVAQNYLKLRFEKPNAKVNLSLVYLQKGVRWIPSYIFQLDGKGTARVQLQATVINEVADLDGVTMNLVVGVPNFLFKDTLDPMAISSVSPQLSQYFSPSRRRAGEQTLSNVITTQMVVADDAPEDTARSEGQLTERKEDLFIFTLKDITLKKGERMSVTVNEFKLNYTDIYTLEIPFTPPSEFTSSYSGTITRDDISRLLAAPKFIHKIRFVNNAKEPITTAPALILSDSQLLGESLISYTPSGATNDLEITKAVEIQASKNDLELGRTPSALNMNGHDYSKTSLEGRLKITNYKAAPVKLEIVRYVLGQVTAATEAETQKLNVFEDDSFLPDTYRIYSWPSWWPIVNTVSRIKWQTTLEPGKSVEYNYKWHYFWR